MDRKLAEGIGAAARVARVQARLTQADVAEQIGMVTEVYGRLERGQMLPSVPRLLKLSRVLRVPATILLGLDRANPREVSAAPPGYGESTEVRRLIRRAQRLDRRRLRLLVVLALALIRD